MGEIIFLQTVHGTWCPKYPAKPQRPVVRRDECNLIISYVVTRLLVKVLQAMFQGQCLPPPQLAVGLLSTVSIHAENSFEGGLEEVEQFKK